jgi:hypothetical protein
MAALSNPRHEAFCQAYTTGETAGNAVKSYLSVYTESTYAAAGNSSYELLKNPEICNRVQELQKTIERGVIRREIRERTVRLEECRKIYEMIVRSLEKKQREKGELDKDDAALLKEGREWLKQAAIEAGQWTERQEHTGSVGVYDASKLAGIPQDKILQMLEMWDAIEAASKPAALPAPTPEPPEKP